MSPPGAHDGVDTDQWLTIRFTRGSRYYRVHLEQDLWGAWCITSVNGRIGTPLGRAATLHARSRAEGLTALTSAAARRFRRGYHFVPTT